VCPQTVGGEHAESFTKHNLTISADCLSLNVFTPHYNCTNEKLPVLVLLHGGEFKHGSSADFGYYGLFDNAVLRGHVVVTLNLHLTALVCRHILHGTVSNQPTSRLLSYQPVQLWLLQAVYNSPYNEAEMQIMRTGTEKLWDENGPQFFTVDRENFWNEFWTLSREYNSPVSLL